MRLSELSAYARWLSSFPVYPATDTRSNQLGSISECLRLLGIIMAAAINEQNEFDKSAEAATDDSAAGRCARQRIDTARRMVDEAITDAVQFFSG